MANLNASIFSKIDITLKNEFEFILTQINACSNLMLTDYLKIENDENKIRNRLYKDYLKSPKIKETLGLENYIFHVEAPEIDDTYKEIGYSDFMIYNPTTYLKDDTAYYIIECKRIDGNKDLNDYYVSQGIDRFISNKYPTYNGLGGMIGFVVKQIDIKNNSKKIPGLKNHIFIKSFTYSYISNHTDAKVKKFILYHLMLDFSSII